MRKPDFQDEEPTVTVPAETLAQTMETLSVATSERPTVRLMRPFAVCPGCDHLIDGKYIHDFCGVAK